MSSPDKIKRKSVRRTPKRVDQDRKALCDGNAGANTAIDHIGMLCDALDQLPAGVHEDPDTPIPVRTDSAGCTHDFLDAVCDMRLAFSVSMSIDEPVRRAILTTPEPAWQTATRQDGAPRDSAWVAELHGLDLSGWPVGSRVICRRDFHVVRRSAAAPRAADTMIT